MISAMIDTETFSTRQDAAVISIGVCVFNDSEIIDKLYLPLRPTHGHIDTSTILWWMKQNDRARYDLIDAETIPDTHAASLLASFAAAHNPEEVWANSPTFDLTILENWWERIFSSKITNPWPLHFRKYRDFRTIRALAKECDELVVRTVPETAHNALSDAIAQAEYIIAQKKLFKETRHAAKG